MSSELSRLRGLEGTRERAATGRGRRGREAFGASGQIAASARRGDGGVGENVEKPEGFRLARGGADRGRQCKRGLGARARRRRSGAAV